MNDMGHDFLEALKIEIDKPETSRLIKYILRYRLARFGKDFLKGIVTMESDFTSYTLALNTKQMTSLPNQIGNAKIRRWQENKESYMSKYIQNSTLSFSRLLAKRWDKLNAAGISVEELGEKGMESSESDFSASQALYDNFEMMFKKKKISADKVDCFRDRFSGMKYSDIMKKYEPENLKSEPKGQKYRRRFDRLLIELEIPKKLIKSYLAEVKIKEKKEKKEKLI